MKKLILYLFIGLIGIWFVSAETAPDILWERTFDFGIGLPSDVKQTTDGGYIITTGCYIPIDEPDPIEDLFLLKTDSLGNLLWNRTYGTESQDFSYKVQQTSDGGYILVGSTGGEQGSMGYSIGFDCKEETSILIVKTDSNGTQEWNKNFTVWNISSGNEFVGECKLAYSIQEISGGGFIISGSIKFENSDPHIHLIKTDSNGNEIWNKTYFELGKQYGYSVIQTNDGGFAIIGTMDRDREVPGFYLLKTASTGEVEWNKTFSGEGYDFGYSLQQTTDAGYILTGYSSSFSMDGTDDVWLIKTDSNGNQQWNKSFGTLEDDRAYSVQQTTEGGYILAGYTKGGITPVSGFIVKTDSLGNQEWNLTITSTELSDKGGWTYTIQQTNDSGYILVGQVRNDVNMDEIGHPIWLVKLCKDNDDNDSVCNDGDECPNTPLGAVVDEFGCSDTANQTVGSDGGNVTTDTGSVTLEIPLDALTTNETITISMNENLTSATEGSILIGGVDAETEEFQALSPVYTLEPDGLEFDENVTLTMQYNASEAIGLEVKIYKFNETAGSWELSTPLGGTIVNGQIYIDINSFSDYVAIGLFDSDDDSIPDYLDKCPETIEEALVRGCSCRQILELKPGEDTAANREGCSKGVIEVFTKTTGWAKDLFEE